MWRQWLHKLSNRSSKQDNDTQDTKHFSEAATLFQEIESLVSQTVHPDRGSQDDIAHLTDIIQKADTLLEFIELHQLGDDGVFRFLTTLYLAQSLGVRGDCYYFQSSNFQSTEISKENRRHALEDYNRAENLPNQTYNSDLIMPEWRRARRCLCYLELDMFDVAIKTAQQLCDIDNSYENFRLLSLCYLKLGDYSKALESATDGIRHSSNDSLRRKAYYWRAEVHQRMGNEYLAAQDSLQSNKYD